MSGKSSKPEALLKNFWLLPHRATSPGFAKNECKRKTLISRWVKSHFRLFALKRSDCTWFELIGRPVNHIIISFDKKPNSTFMCWSGNDECYPKEITFYARSLLFGKTPQQQNLAEIFKHFVCYMTCKHHARTWRNMWPMAVTLMGWLWPNVWARVWI